MIITREQLEPMERWEMVNRPITDRLRHGMDDVTRYLGSDIMACSRLDLKLAAERLMLASKSLMVASDSFPAIRPEVDPSSTGA